jgi:hypothetical protein
LVAVARLDDDRDDGSASQWQQQQRVSGPVAEVMISSNESGDAWQFHPEEEQRCSALLSRGKGNGDAQQCHLDEKWFLFKMKNGNR